MNSDNNLKTQIKYTKQEEVSHFVVNTLKDIDLKTPCELLAVISLQSDFRMIYLVQVQKQMQEKKMLHPVDTAEVLRASVDMKLLHLERGHKLQR